MSYNRENTVTTKNSHIRKQRDILPTYILFVLQLEVVEMKSAVMSNSSVAMLQENASPRGGNVTTTKIVKMARTNMTVVSTLINLSHKNCRPGGIFLVEVR